MSSGVSECRHYGISPSRHPSPALGLARRTGRGYNGRRSPQPPEFMPTAAAPDARIVDVAAAVILQADGQFLLARRPEGRAYAGYWEFPGGKIEAGEDARAALARELHEELGIEVDEVCPWLTRVYVYPEWTVRLHFFRACWPAYRTARGPGTGLANSRCADGRAAVAGQRTPILQALTLPAMYAITTPRFGVEFLNRVQGALDGGVRLIQVRERIEPGS